MRRFTQAEIDYLQSQRLGRPHRRPDGHRMSCRLGLGTTPSSHDRHWRPRFRQAQEVSRRASNPWVAFVVDALAPGAAWSPRMIESAARPRNWVGGEQVISGFDRDVPHPPAPDCQYGDRGRRKLWARRPLSLLAALQLCRRIDDTMSWRDEYCAQNRVADDVETNTIGGGMIAMNDWNRQTMIEALPGESLQAG